MKLAVEVSSSVCGCEAALVEGMARWVGCGCKVAVDLVHTALVSSLSAKHGAATAPLIRKAA